MHERMNGPMTKCMRTRFLILVNFLYLPDSLSKVSPTLMLTIQQVYEGLLCAWDHTRYKGHGGEQESQGSLSSWSFYFSGTQSEHFSEGMVCPVLMCVSPNLHGDQDYVLLIFTPPAPSSTPSEG